MQNLKKNWLVLWKITWGILEIFTRALENWDSKLGLLWGTSITSRKCISLKVSGELCVMTMKKMQNLKRNWLVQNWHEEFNKFWPKHSKISKICTLMGCFWPKYIMLQLRKYREVMFDGTQDWLKKFEGKLICCFKNDKNLVNFDPSTQKSQKFALWLVLSSNIWPKKVQRSCLLWH